MQLPSSLSDYEHAILRPLQRPIILVDTKPVEAERKEIVKDVLLMESGFVSELGFQVVRKTETIVPNRNNSVIHEAFIGIFVTNKLNNITSNFVPVLGFNIADEVIIDSRKVRVAIVYEQFVCGELFSKIFATMLYKDFRAIIIQIVLSLSCGYEAFQFIHGDVHGNNIIIVTLPEPHEILFDSKVIAVSRYRPIFIDFGMSSAVVNGQKFDFAIDDIDKYIPKFLEWQCDLWQVLGIINLLKISPTQIIDIENSGKIHYIATAESILQQPNITLTSFVEQLVALP